MAREPVSNVPYPRGLHVNSIGEPVAVDVSDDLQRREGVHSIAVDQRRARTHDERDSLGADPCQQVSAQCLCFVCCLHPERYAPSCRRRWPTRHHQHLDLSTGTEARNLVFRDVAFACCFVAKDDNTRQ